MGNPQLQVKRCQSHFATACTLRRSYQQTDHWEKKGGGGKGKLYTETTRKTEKMDHATGLHLTTSIGTTTKSFWTGIV